MKETKFRAWDKENNCWFSKVDFLIDMDGVVYYMESFGKFVVLPKERYELVFYTGLKDKTDKDIYEGDIVREEMAHDEIPIIDQVIFENGCFWIKECEDTLYGNDFEVIGNIYENPELIPKYK